MRLQLGLIILTGIMMPLAADAAQKGKQTPAQKADERRENEAVRKAQQDMKAAQELETSSERSLKRAADELKSVEQRLAQAVSQLQKTREDLESKHAETSGLLAARRNAEIARRSYEVAGQPILQRLTETDKYQQALDAAKAADIRLERLRNAVDGEADDRRKLTAEAARVKLVPGQMEREALDAEPALQSERTRLAAAEDAVARARKLADQSIDKDPALRVAVDKVERIKQEAVAARRAVAKEERQLSDARQKLAREQADLQQKIAADRRDDNKPKKK